MGASTRVLVAEVAAVGASALAVVTSVSLVTRVLTFVAYVLSLVVLEALLSDRHLPPRSPEDDGGLDR